MKKFFESFLDFIYKRKCYFCGSSKETVKMCSKCYEKLEFAESHANRITAGVNIYCAGVYTKKLQKLIRALKYHRQKELAYYQAKFMYDYFLKLKEIENKEFELVPVPLHPNRIKKRKYNHMELVCKEFSNMSGFGCNFELIKRVKDTVPQYKLSRKQRLENLKQAFTADKNLLKGKPILLMDDICTTGATFEEIIRTLKSAGVKDIVCFATSSPAD